MQVGKKSVTGQHGRGDAWESPTLLTQTQSSEQAGAEGWALLVGTAFTALIRMSPFKSRAWSGRS